LVLDDGGFEGVGEAGVELAGEVEEEGFVDEVAGGAVGELGAASFDWLDQVFDADGGGEAGEKDAVGFEGSPGVFEHGEEVAVVAGEVEDGAEEDYVELGVGEGHGFDGFVAEVGGGEVGGELAGGGDGGGVGIGGVDLVVFAEEVDEIAAVAAAGVEDVHSGSDSAAEDLIEEVDVDGAELVVEGWHD